MMNFWERNFRPAEWQARYREGYDWVPFTPHPPVALSHRRKMGLCHANNKHYAARNGSWVFGASVCGSCGMYFNYWPKEMREAAADSINRLPADQQQGAAARISGNPTARASAV